MSQGYFDLTTLSPVEAEAYLTAYSFRYTQAKVGEASLYLDKYMFTPPEGVDQRIRTVLFPIPLTALELRLFKGRRRFTRGGTRFIKVKKRPYQEGLEEYVYLMTDPAWTGFATGPERLRKLVKTWPTRAAALLINSGETTASWKGGNFLSASVPSNPLKVGGPTYKTFWPATPLTHDNVQAMIAEMANRRDLEGDPIGLIPTTLFCSAPLMPLAMEIAKDDLVSDTKISNPVKKYNLTVEVWPDLAPTRWGLLMPSALEDYQLFNFVKGNEDIEVLDRTSYLFQSEKKMGVSVDVDLGIALARNEAISVAKTTP